MTEGHFERHLLLPCSLMASPPGACTPQRTPNPLCPRRSSSRVNGLFVTSIQFSLPTANLYCIRLPISTPMLFFLSHLWLLVCWAVGISPVAKLDRLVSLKAGESPTHSHSERTSRALSQACVSCIWLLLFYFANSSDLSVFLGAGVTREAACHHPSLALLTSVSYPHSKYKSSRKIYPESTS